MKKNSIVATSKLAAIIEQLQLHHYFSYKSYAWEKSLIMHIAHVLPHAAATINSLFQLLHG